MPQRIEIDERGSQLSHTREIIGEGRYRLTVDTFNYERGRPSKHYGIVLDGRVQITGAHFEGRRQYETAVKALNEALGRGACEVTLQGWNGPFTWNLQRHNQGLEV